MLASKMGAAVSKASVALFLLRTTVKRWHVVLLWICIASTTFLCTVTTILMFVQCKPVSFLWNQTIEYGHCWLAFTDVELIMGGTWSFHLSSTSIKHTDVLSKAWSTAINFLLALLPWHVITSLNMNRSEKATIACGLSLGVLAGACSLVRTIELKPLSSMDNYVYDTSSMLLWFSSEVCLTIICACIPVLRPLYIRVTSGNKDDSLEEISYPSSTFGKREKRQSSLSYKKVSRASLPRIFMGPIGGVMQTIINPGRDDESEMSILRGGNEQKFGCFLCLDDAERGDVQTRDIVVTTSIVTNEEVGSMV